MEKISKIDEIDEKILSELSKNSREKVSKIAKKLNLPITTVFTRLKKLEKSGVIRKFTIEINHRMLGKDVKAIILIKYNPTSRITQKELAKRIKAFNQIEKVFVITGDWDLIAVGVFSNTKELSSFILEKLREIKGIKETFTSIVLEEI